MADRASSKDLAPPSDASPSERAAAKDGQSPTAEPETVGSDTFANTKKHAAGQEAGAGTTERFANTKLNIALINDPTNGPRFTMTKRESGLQEKDGDGQGGTGSPSSAEPKTASAAEAGKAKPPSDGPEQTGGSGQAPAPTDDRQDGDGKPGKPGDEGVPATALRAAQTGVPPAAIPPDKVPVDSSKTFVGRNGTYYDESWRWMDWRGTRQSWNWPAALSLGHWFAYRRLHLFAGLYLLWLAGMAAATVNNVPVLALAALAFLAVGLAGVYGNTLYFLAFRRAVDHVTKNGEGSYQELQSQLAKAGGTSIPALGVMGTFTLAGIAAALGVTYHLRGGFLFNFWPF